MEILTMLAEILNLIPLKDDASRMAIVMNEEDKIYLASLKTVQVRPGVTEFAKTLVMPKEVHQLGEVLNSIFGATRTLLNSNEFLKVAGMFGELSLNVVQQMGNPNSELGKLLRVVNDFSSVVGKAAITPDSDLNKLLRAVSKIGDGFNSAVPKFVKGLVVEDYELFDLIRSGQITAEQVSSSFDEALSRDLTLDVSEAFVVGEKRSSIVDEIILAFMEAGSLKGVSTPALKFFLALFITMGAIFTTINAGFDLQKNIGERFTSVKTPAEARSLARHPPASVNKEDLSRFRILVGDRVSLREGPGQKYLSVKQLPLGSLLQVLDASEKSWLMVSVAEDGEIYEGWVLRGYTKPIR